MGGEGEGVVEYVFRTILVPRFIKGGEEKRFSTWTRKKEGEVAEGLYITRPYLEEEDHALSHQELGGRGRKERKLNLLLGKRKKEKGERNSHYPGEKRKKGKEFEKRRGRN